ncbi:hypothetical protein VNI00_006396 [Paramarasmius palmivorus]|uniref:Uncharacterized protein n=1 Tax=Paramarasmius palmivorus TaxID=297713 RepID=A0AAW0D4S1_9AGAR
MISGSPVPLILTVEDTNQSQAPSSTYTDPLVIARIGRTCPQAEREVSPDPALPKCPSFENFGPNEPLAACIQRSKDFLRGVKEWLKEVEDAVRKIEDKEVQREHRQACMANINAWKLEYQEKRAEIRREQREKQGAAQRLKVATMETDKEPPQKKQRVDASRVTCEQCLHFGDKCIKGNSGNVVRCNPCIVKRRGCSFCGTPCKRAKSTKSVKKATPSQSDATNRDLDLGKMDTDLYGCVAELADVVKQLIGKVSTMEKERQQF